MRGNVGNNIKVNCLSFESFSRRNEGRKINYKKKASNERTTVEEATIIYPTLFQILKDKHKKPIRKRKTMW